MFGRGRGRGGLFDGFSGDEDDEIDALLAEEGFGDDLGGGFDDGEDDNLFGPTENDDFEDSLFGEPKPSSVRKESRRSPSTDREEQKQDFPVQNGRRRSSSRDPRSSSRRDRRSAEPRQERSPRREHRSRSRDREPSSRPEQRRGRERGPPAPGRSSSSSSSSAASRRTDVEFSVPLEGQPDLSGPRRPKEGECGVGKCMRQAFKSGFCATHLLASGGEIDNLPGGGELKNKPSGWWDKKNEPISVWQALKTKEGLDYYFNTETNETTWDKPEELMTPEELNATGDWRWVPDPVDVYIPGKLLEGGKKPGSKALFQLEDGRQISVKTPGEGFEELQRSSLQRIVSDLVLLDRMSAPLILHCLRKRFEDRKIYTNVGTILISVNPYQMLPLYTPEVEQRYINREPGVDLPPHVFNIAHDSYWGMKEFGVNQSIIISGESGAGKTEATKQCLRYLATMAGSVGGVEKKVLQANPILEAFGNAKTIRNDNSSRFGKYIEIYFTGEGKIRGSATKNYLLEKIRVVNPGPNERDFHIFYQLTKAADNNLRKKLNLRKPNEYRYIEGCIDVETIDDGKDFAEVLQAFKDLGFTAQEQGDMFALVAAVLKLGNMRFESYGRDETRVLEEPKPEENWVQQAADLLQVDVERLKKSLSVRELRVPGQKTALVNLTPKQAADTRDALAKFLYGYQFDWLVQRVNLAMGQCPPNLAFIGILDIFGFEIFEQNSLEQLCINFTNEMLQQHFNMHTFKLEEQMYAAEQIKFEHIKFIDNKPMIDLITKRPHGVMPLLNEELVVPQGSDRGFLEKLSKYQNTNRVFDRPKRKDGVFIIRHYAGEVSYDVSGFLEKNRDTLTVDLLEMLSSSQSSHLQACLFPPERQQMSSREAKSSLSRQFQRQLEDLMKQLNSTEPHYIRCIKPNDFKNPHDFVPKNCYEQLTYSGVFEAVSIRKQGFPFRLTHEVFAKRYSCIFGYEAMYRGGGDPKPVCRKICAEMKLDPTNVQMGRTRMLYRADEHKSLELIRSIKMQVIEVEVALDDLMEKYDESMSYEAKEEFFKKVAEALRGADEFRIKTPIADRARKLLEAYVEQRMDPETRRMLENAQRSLVREDLEAVLRRCDEKGYRTKLTNACRELLEKVIEADAALELSIDAKDEDDLKEAIRGCGDFNYKGGARLPQAKLLLYRIQQAKRLCKAAVESVDHINLDKAIAFCDAFQYDSEAVKKARSLLSRILELRRRLSDAKRKIEERRLQRVIDDARNLGYRDRLVDDCKDLQKRVSRVLSEVRRASKSLDEQHVRVVVRAAEELDLLAHGSGSTISELRRLKKLLSGSQDDFLNQQYKRAVKLGDHPRAIRIAIQRKNLQHDPKRRKSGNEPNLNLASWPRLKDPLKWGKESWWPGSARRAANFLVWQKDIIHSPLTHPPTGEQGLMVDPARVKLLRKKIIAAHETIQKFMQQRSPKNMEQKLLEMLSDGMLFPDIRSDIYFLIMKQFIQNPEPAKNVLAVELFGLCLTQFPPGEDLEEYMEHFIRQPEWIQLDRLNTPGLLRQRVYEASHTDAGGNQSSGRPPFSPAEMNRETLIPFILRVADRFKDRSRKNASYKDLEMSFYDRRKPLKRCRFERWISAAPPTDKDVEGDGVDDDEEHDDGYDQLDESDDDPGSRRRRNGAGRADRRTAHDGDDQDEDSEFEVVGEEREIRESRESSRGRGRDGRSREDRRRSRDRSRGRSRDRDSRRRRSRDLRERRDDRSSGRSERRGGSGRSRGRDTGGKPSSRDRSSRSDRGRSERSSGRHTRRSRDRSREASEKGRARGGRSERGERDQRERRRGDRSARDRREGREPGGERSSREKRSGRSSERRRRSRERRSHRDRRERSERDRS